MSQSSSTRQACRVLVTVENGDVTAVEASRPGVRVAVLIKDPTIGSCVEVMGSSWGNISVHSADNSTPDATISDFNKVRDRIAQGIAPPLTFQSWWDIFEPTGQALNQTGPNLDFEAVPRLYAAKGLDLAEVEAVYRVFPNNVWTLIRSGDELFIRPGMQVALSHSNCPPNCIETDQSVASKMRSQSRPN